jgi:protoporphyrinogen oxidase
MTTLGAGVTAFGALAGCTTFDDYLFDDKNDLEQEIVIVGGGISGLYAAHLFRSKSIDFRLFEASPYFGGRIKSVGIRDYGANLLSQRDELITKMVDEFKLEKIFVDRDFYYLEAGMQSVIENLKERVLGLIPYRQFRMRWKLIEIKKLTAGYELTFQKPDGQTKVRCKKLVLTLSPPQLLKVKGLSELPEIQPQFALISDSKTDFAVRLILPPSAFSTTPKNFQNHDLSDFKIKQLVKKTKGVPIVELDVQYNSNLITSIDSIYAELKKKLQMNYPFSKLNNDQFYFWGRNSVSAGAFFHLNENKVISTSNSIFLAGDFWGQHASIGIEAALQSVKNAFKNIV